jgi:endonuclease I
MSVVRAGKGCTGHSHCASFLFDLTSGYRPRSIGSHSRRLASVDGDHISPVDEKALPVAVTTVVLLVAAAAAAAVRVAAAARRQRDCAIAAMTVMFKPITAFLLLLTPGVTSQFITINGTNVTSDSSGTTPSFYYNSSAPSNATYASNSSTPPPYDNCNASVYYASLIGEYGSDPTAWPRSAVADWLKATHRNVLPNTAEVRGGDDILMALIDLDPGNVTGETVHLIYRDISFPALPAGNPNTWSREDLWPLKRGIPRNSSGLTDVHSKKPADSTVLLKKQALFFGQCGTVETIDQCSRPATVETAPTSEQDNKIFGPPDDARGPIARALFYTATRYNPEFDLELTDCPPFGPSQFGYLSPLLEWHAQYPVTPEEITRNDRACTRWQGNRNIFVDYPQLVETYFGTPVAIDEGTLTYDGCTAPTMSPTATPNDCSTLKAGDLPVFVLNSDAPDQVVLFPLAEIPASVGSIYITDNAWNGTHLMETEGTVEVSINVNVCVYNERVFVVYAMMGVYDESCVCS